MPSGCFARCSIWFILAIVVAIGFLLRVQSVMYTEVDRPIRADARDYVVSAYNLKFSQTYSRSAPRHNEAPQPDAYRPPGYPLFLTLFLDKSLSQTSLRHVLFAQVVLSTLVILLAYSLFSRLLGPPLALVCALLTALSPHLITGNIYFLTESLFSFLLLTFLWLFSRLKAMSHFVLLVGLGIVLALSSLTRPWLQYFIVLFVPLLLYSSLPGSQSRKICLYAVGGFLSIMSIWIIRNLFVSKAEVSILSLSILAGMYPNMMYNNLPETYAYPWFYDPRTTEITASLSSLSREMIRRFQEMPIEHLRWYLLGKPIALLSWNTVQGAGDVFIYPVLRTPYAEFLHFKVSHEIMRLIHYPLVIFAVMGSLIAWLPNRKVGVGEEALLIVRCISMLFYYFIVVHMAVMPVPRYSFPMLPVIYGMALFGARQVFVWIRSKIAVRIQGLLTDKR